MTELEAARFVRAGLELLRDALPFGDVREHVTSYMVDMDAQVDARAANAPPWTSEPVQAIVPWSLVACGDEVQAPNGQWYKVTGMARVGQQVTAMLNETIRSSVKATDKAPTRRGPVGQAMDVLLAGGLELELIGASE